MRGLGLPLLRGLLFSVSRGPRLTPCALFLRRLAAPHAQNTNRRANCMKRGVVSVETYLPNSDASKESEG